MQNTEVITTIVIDRDDREKVQTVIPSAHAVSSDTNQKNSNLPRKCYASNVPRVVVARCRQITQSRTRPVRRRRLRLSWIPSATGSLLVQDRIRLSNLCLFCADFLLRHVIHSSWLYRDYRSRLRRRYQPHGPMKLEASTDSQHPCTVAFTVASQAPGTSGT